jgi:hypothetical protein
MPAVVLACLVLRVHARIVGDSDGPAYVYDAANAVTFLGRFEGFLIFPLYLIVVALIQDAEALIDGSTEAERAAKEAQRREQAAEATRRKAAEEAEAAARAAAWDGEEVRLLEKALVKYPVVSNS